jgi:hypothetical protein
VSLSAAVYNRNAIDCALKPPQNQENRHINGIEPGKDPAVRHKGEILARTVSLLISLGMWGCFALFTVEKKFTTETMASYLIAVLACSVFVTPWPWRENSRARFYVLLGVLWTSAAAGAWFRDQSVTATLYGVAAALSFWGSLTIVASRAATHAGHAHASHAPQMK